VKAFGLRSIGARLTALALAAVAVGWLAAVVLTYRDAREEIDALLDAHLAQAAALLVAQASHELEEVETEHARAPRYARQVAFQVWEDGRKLRLHSIDAPATPLGDGKEGYTDRVIDGVAWRVYSAWDDSHEYLIEVGERRAVREDIAGQIAKHLLRPILFALPALALLLWLAIRSGLSPLARLAGDVGRRAPDNLAPLDAATAPREVSPLVEQLNRLFRRVTESLENERRFTADAAHELRTPIAAVKAQAQVARAARNDAERDRAIDQAIRGCDRAGHLVDQLLTLARLDAPEELAKRPTDLGAIAGEAVAELAPVAHAAGVALELAEATTSLQVAAVPELLHVLLRNLIDNAIRYGPPGATVRVVVERDDGRPCLAVIDEGPGIADSEQHLATKRFYRGLGSGKSGAGLGLSIVQRIAELHGAELHLRRGYRDRGLRASVVFGRGSGAS
jgi:two-component system sensor histidine kinase QseC